MSERTAMFDILGLTIVLSVIFEDYFGPILIGMFLFIVFIKVLDSFIDKKPRNEYGWDNKKYIKSQIRKYKQGK